jgi:hypothetical protein
MSFGLLLELEKKIGPNDRVLVVNPLNTDWSYQLTSEIALRLKELNAQVKWVNISDRTPKRFHINPRDFLPRWRYFSPERNVSKVLESHGVEIDSNFVRRKSKAEKLCFRNVQELKVFNYQGINIGAMIFSAISSNFKSTAFQLEEITDHINYYWELIGAMEANLMVNFDNFQPTMVVTINDRLVGAALALSMASQKGILKSVVYWGSNSESIQDYENSLYDAQEWRKQIQRSWDSKILGGGVKNEIIDSIISDAQTPTQDSKSFTQNQKASKSISKIRPTCVFYAQSEYEHSAYLVDLPTDRFKNQYEAFQSLQDVCEELEFDLYIKFHPLRAGENNAGLSKRYAGEWSEVQFNDCVKVIDQDSDIDTYQLIVDADVNALWSGSTGPEAILKGNPPLVLGNPPWLNFDWGIHAWTRGQIRSQLLNGTPILQPSVLAPWFSFLGNYGVPVKYSTLKRGRLTILDTVVIKDSLLFRAFHRLKNLN